MSSFFLYFKDPIPKVSQMNGHTEKANGVAPVEKKPLTVQDRTRSWQEELVAGEIDIPGTPRPRKNTQPGNPWGEIFTLKLLDIKYLLTI